MPPYLADLVSIGEFDINPPIVSSPCPPIGIVKPDTDKAVFSSRKVIPACTRTSFSRGSISSIRLSFSVDITSPVERSAPPASCPAPRTVTDTGMFLVAI